MQNEGFSLLSLSHDIPININIDPNDYWGYFNYVQNCAKNKIKGKDSDMRNKLTKTFLMELQEGDYLVSNLFPSKDKSAFAEKVSSLSERKNNGKE